MSKKNIVKQENNWVQWLIVLFFLSVVFQGVKSCYYNLTVDYCDCKEAAADWSLWLVTRDYGSFDESVIRHCAEEIIDDLDLDMDADDMTDSFMTQVSYEMCKYGYYERRGEKFYD